MTPSGGPAGELDGALEGTADEARRWALEQVLPQVAAALGDIVAIHGEVEGTAPGWRLLLEIAGVGPAFLKAGDGDAADEAVGAEIALISTLRHRHMPYILAGDPLAAVPWMVQRDLSAATWPPPWLRRIDAIYAAVRRTSKLDPPPWLPRPADLDPWTAAIESLTEDELADPPWWSAAAERLGEAARRVSIAGDALVHGDLGSGNVCLHDGTVLLIDWSDAMVADPAVDLMSVAVDAAHHDGVRRAPPVEDLPAWLAKTAGLLVTASRRAPWPGPRGQQVRRQQQALARTATAWALDAVG